METFTQDTALDCIVKPSRGFRRKKLQRYERASYSALIIHTTGMGVHRKAKRWKVDPFLAALRIYSQQMDASGHYVIGQLGQLAQCVPEEIVAWHVGSKGAAAYHRASWWRAKKVAWWRERWPQYVAPGQLARGHLWATSPTTCKPSCNSNVIGFEVVPPPDNGEWSAECWATIAELSRDVSERREIVLSLETVLSHSDAHPRSRSARGKPWDPGPKQWSYEKFAIAAGLPLVLGG